MRKVVPMPDHTHENPSLDEAGVAKFNLGESATAEELKAEETRLLEEWFAESYARNRKKAYPDWRIQLDDLYHKGAFSDEMAAKLKAVKDAYSKE